MGYVAMRVSDSHDYLVVQREAARDEREVEFIDLPSARSPDLTYAAHVTSMVTIVATLSGMEVARAYVQFEEGGKLFRVATTVTPHMLDLPQTMRLLEALRGVAALAQCVSRDADVLAASGSEEPGPLRAALARLVARRDWHDLLRVE